MSNSSIWLIDKSPSDATTPSQSRTRSDGNEWVLCISKAPTFRWLCVINRTLVGGGSYLSAEMLSGSQTSIYFLIWWVTLLNHDFCKTSHRKLNQVYHVTEEYSTGLSAVGFFDNPISSAFQDHHQGMVTDRFPWLSLSLIIYPSQLSLMARPLDGNQCLHRTDEYKFYSG